MTLRGTPFIYEGEELGLTNVAWKSIDSYNDISSQGQYDFAIKEGFTDEQAMEFVHFFSRDNARTPMQWNGSNNAGFSTAKKTWLPVNENYKTVNAAEEEKNPDSVLAWYKKLSKFRQENQVLTAGDYELLMPDSEEIFAFARTFDGKTFLTFANFSSDNVPLPKNFSYKKILLDSEKEFDKNFLKPLEARICEK